jgi:hypothetical protein
LSSAMRAGAMLGFNTTWVTAKLQRGFMEL